MGGLSQLIRFGALLRLSFAVDVNKGENCMAPRDSCLPETLPDGTEIEVECAMLMYCKENYKECQKFESSDHKYIYYNFQMYPGDNGICFSLSYDSESCDEIQEGCMSTYCNGDTNTCEAYCESDSDCSPSKNADITGKTSCIETVEQCGEHFDNCGSDTGTLNYIPSTGDPGHCYLPGNRGDVCDDHTNACKTGFSCGTTGVCELTCLNDSECGSNEVCVIDLKYCDFENNCDLSNDADPNFAWLIYDSSGSVGDIGVCRSEGLQGAPCDEHSACSTGLVCKDDTCSVLCNEGTLCMKSSATDLMCIKRFNYCDANYQACSYDPPTAPNDEFTIIYEKPSGGEYGTCYEEVETEGAHVSPDCTDLSKSCPDLHCDVYGFCQDACDETRSCGESNETCLGFVEFCSNSNYNKDSCQLEYDESLDYVKFTEFKHTDQTEGLCYNLFSSYSAECNLENVCESRYCETSKKKGCDDTYQMRCNDDGDCDPFMTCLVMEECDGDFKNCGGAGVTGTIHYMKYDKSNTDHDNRGFCRYDNDLDEECDTYEEACESGWCDNTGVCKEHCDLGFGACGTDEICIYKIDYCDAKFTACSDKVTTDNVQYIEVTSDQNGEKCYSESGIGEPCDIDDNACGTGLYCDLDTGLCVKPCLSGCTDEEQCLSGIESCDPNYTDCGSTHTSNSFVYISSNVDYDLCYHLAQEAESCNLVNTCLGNSTEHGYCNNSGKCQDVCATDSKCPDGYMCISEVLFCDGTGTCNESYSSTADEIHYSYDSISGHCYVEGSDGDACDVNSACSSKKCIAGLCEKDDKSCLTQDECTTEGELCVIVEYCNENYESCQDSESGYVTAHYIPIEKSSSSGTGYCFPVNETGDSCDPHLNACEHNWCGEKGFCVNHCESTTDCNDGLDCVATIEYCDDALLYCTATNDGTKTSIQYTPGSPGQCFDLQEDGGICDDESLGCVDSSCKNGICGDSVAECVSDADCTDGVCINLTYWCVDHTLSNCVDSTVNPDPTVYHLTGGWYDASDSAPGICYHVVDEGQPCEAQGDHCELAVSFCYDGICRLACNDWTWCPSDMSCVDMVEYCDANYADCNTTGDSFVTLHYEINGTGLCYENAAGGINCDAVDVCASGHCNQVSECETMCTDDDDCADTEACFSTVEYCDDSFESCVPEQDSSLTNIHFDSDGSPGYCYNNGDIGDPCSINEGCKSGFCDGSKCIQFARKCNTNSDCKEGLVCTSTEECDANYESCIGGVSGNPVETIHYSEVLSDTTQEFYCRKLQDDGEKCNVFQEACLSGWCDEDGFCDNYCKTPDDCVEGSVCISKVQYCSKPGVCGSTSESNPLKEYIEGAPGVCFAAGARGDQCDDIDMGCESLYCHNNSKCASPCYSTDDCIVSGLDHEVCITSIEYCDKENNDHTGFEGCSFTPDDNAFAKFYSNQGDYGICMEVKGEYRECNDYNLGCVGDHAYENNAEYRHVCIQDSISGDQTCFVDVSTVDNKK